MLSLTMEIGDHNWWCSHQHFYFLNKSDLSMASYRHGIKYVFTCAPNKAYCVLGLKSYIFTCTNLRRFRVTHNWRCQFDNNNCHPKTIHFNNSILVLIFFSFKLILNSFRPVKNAILIIKIKFWVFLLKCYFHCEL